MTGVKAAQQAVDQRLRQSVLKHGQCPAEGRRLLRRGGSLCWLLNNCGNLVAPMDKQGQPAPKKTRNYVGFAQAGTSRHHFFIFQSYEAGREEVKAWFMRRGQKSLADCITKEYAPSHENDSKKYVADVVAMTGLDAERLVGTFSDAEMDKLLDALERKEGYHKDAHTRQETWVEATSITVSNGTAPIAGFELQLEHNGQTQTIKANEAGQFKALAHPPKGALVVKAPKADGTWHKVLELGKTSASQAVMLLIDWFTASASMQSDAAPKAAKSNKSPVQYRVQPGDSLSKIATKFHTTAQEIKQINKLQKDLIHPDQKLWIYGRGRDVGVNTPKPTAPKTAPAAQTTAKASAAVPKTQGADTVPVVRGQEGEGKPLALVNAIPGRAPWMEVALDEARKQAGHYESEKSEKSAIAKNKTTNGVIYTNYHKEVGTGSKNLETAWCAAFVNWCLMKAGYPYSHSASSQFPVHDAKRFVKIYQPVYGALVVYKHKNSTQGHVAFVYHRIKSKFLDDLAVLGGNQGDQITLNAHSRYRDGEKMDVIGFYVPIAYSEIAKNKMNDVDDLGEEVSIGDLTKSLKVSVNFSSNTR